MSVPVRLDIPRMLLALRHEAVERTPQPFALRIGLKMFARVATRPRLYRAATALVRRLLRARARDGWIAKRAWDGARLDGVSRSARAGGADLRATVAPAAGVEARRMSDARDGDSRSDRIGQCERARIPETRSPERLALATLMVDRGSALPSASGDSLGDRFILEARAVGIELFVDWCADAVAHRLGKLVTAASVCWRGTPTSCRTSAAPC